MAIGILGIPCVVCAICLNIRFFGSGESTAKGAGESSDDPKSAAAVAQQHRA